MAIVKIVLSTTAYLYTHHNKRVGYPGYDIEARLEYERQVAKDASEEIDNHERDGNSDDLTVLIDLVVLWTRMISSLMILYGHHGMMGEILTAAQLRVRLNSLSRKIGRACYFLYDKPAIKPSFRPSTRNDRKTSMTPLTRMAKTIPASKPPSMKIRLISQRVHLRSDRFSL